MPDLVVRSGGLVVITQSVTAAVSALLSVGAATIHAWVVPEHLREYWLFGAFFIAVAAGQLVWAGAAMRWRNPIIYPLGAAGSAALIGLWLISRTTGLPVGPEPWEPEAAAALDTTCVLLESGIVALAGIGLLTGRRTGVAGRLTIRQLTRSSGSP